MSLTLALGLMHDDAADSLQSSVVPLRLPHRHLEGTVLRAASGTVRYSIIQYSIIRMIPVYTVTVSQKR